MLLNNLHNLSYYSPGHFLTEELTTQIPNTDLTDLNVSSLTRWQQMQNHLEQFCNCWPHYCPKHFSTIVIGKAGVTTSSSATFCKPDDASGDIETPAPPVSAISAVKNTLQYVTAFQATGAICSWAGICE